jgi:hypothetical protein
MGLVNLPVADLDSRMMSRALWIVASGPSDLSALGSPSRPDHVSLPTVDT